jgi:hypothetical protein
MRPVTPALFAAILLCISSLEGDLQAYLDPGSGSMALQLILGGAVAALAAVKLYWDRVKMFVMRGRVEEGVARERQ